MFLIVRVHSCVCVCVIVLEPWGGGPRGTIDKNSNFYPLLAKNFQNSVCKPPRAVGGGTQGGPTDKNVDFYPPPDEKLPLEPRGGATYIIYIRVPTEMEVWNQAQLNNVHVIQ